MVNVQGNFAEFTFFRPQARQVHIVGDFNHWRERQLPMLKTPDGHWRARVMLPAGTFKFRYCADGEWFTDYAAFGVEYGPFGPDSLVHVEDLRARKNTHDKEITLRNTEQAEKVA